MKKKRKIFLAICTLFLLSSCKFNVTTDLYVADVREVATNQISDINSVATLELEMLSEKQCSESVDEIVKLMEGLVLNVSPRGCVERGFNTYLLVDTDIPVVNSEAVWRQVDSMLGIMALASEGFVEVYVMNDVQKFEILSKRVRDEYFQSLEISESKIKIVLNNDRQDETIIARGIFLNENPVDGYKEFELKRRRKLEITLSDVGATHLGSNGSALAFILKL